MVQRYLIDTGQSENDAKDLAFGQGIQRYGVVDGIHTFRCLSDLERSRPEPFHDFKWTVAIIEWQPIRVLTAFSRARNMLQTAHAVDMTLYDTISGLHEIAVHKANLAGESLESFMKTRGRISLIADEYSGGTKYARQTIRTLAGAALRIKREALEVLGRIMTEENDELARRVLEKHSSCKVLPENVFDARAYKTFISTNTIRGAKAFLDAGGYDQCNALLRLKFSYEANGFKTFQAPRLNQEIERCRRARRQDIIMKNLMGHDGWPAELAVVRKRLFQTSVFDSELDQCEENTHTLIGSLISEYREKRPLEAGLRLHLYLSHLSSVTRASTNSAPHSDSGANETSGNEAMTNDNHEDTVDDSGMDDFAPSPASFCPLQHLGLHCLNMSIEKYSLTRGSGDDKFHLVLGDPTQLQLNGTCKVIIDDRMADNYVRILKLLVYEHGWIFFYTTPVDFAMWNKAFKANGFVPLAYPWVMVRDTETIQANTSLIPQNITELLIGARKAGIGPPDHQPNITTIYERSVSSRKRKFAIMDNCPEPTLKLRKPNTREPLRTNQRSAEPIAEFLETFCPAGGFVLDAFAGTMETAKACFMTRRKCVALEEDSFCYGIALESLKENATAFLEQTALTLPRSTQMFNEIVQESTQNDAGCSGNRNDVERETREAGGKRNQRGRRDGEFEVVENVSDEHEPVLASPVTSDSRKSLQV